MAGENSSENVSENPMAEATKAVGIGEKAGCCCLNLGCLFIVLGVLALISMIVSGIANPLDALSIALGTLWHALVGGK
ncbi:MAG: hypothetical protein WC467_03525 [Patescibacteria group bacterium]